MEKDEIIKVLTQIFDNTKHIHPKSDWVKIAIHKSADYLIRKFSKPKEDKERKEIMKRYGIWEYFNEQHNLQLLESEVDEVVSLALKDNYVKKEIKTAGEIKHKIIK